MSSKISQEKQRLKYLLWSMIEKYQPSCYLCHESFIRDKVLPARGIDNLTEHHIYGNHLNMKIENRVLTHRKCHKKFHVRDNINRWSDSQGEVAWEG